MEILILIANLGEFTSTSSGYYIDPTKEKTWGERERVLNVSKAI